MNLRWILCWLVLMPVAQADLRMPEVQRVTLDNGAVLLLMERHDVPLIAVHAEMRGGALLDQATQFGTASLLAEWLNKGAGSRDAVAWADALAMAGATLDAHATLESVVIEGSFLARDQSLLVTMVTDLLRRPRFDESLFVDLQQRRIEELRAAKDGDLGSLTPIYASAALFGAHPYARPVTGSEASVARITAAAARQQYQDHWGADRLVLAVAGDFDARALAETWRHALADWTRASKPLPLIPAPQRHHGRQVWLIDAPGATQSYFWLGQIGITRTDAERVPLQLVNTWFGGRYTSLLNTELRIKSGLTYGARSQWRSYTQPGSWAMSSFTRSDTTARAIDLALQSYANLRRQGLDAVALDSVQRYLLGQYVTSYETAGQWAAVMASLELASLPRNEVGDYAARLRAVTVNEANRALRRKLPASDDLVMVVIGDADRIRSQLQKYGPIRQLSLAADEFTP